jgi:hypothetical protein
MFNVMVICKTLADVEEIEDDASQLLLTLKQARFHWFIFNGKLNVEQI